MKFKKIATAAGVTAAGAALFISTQGSAQAAPAQPVAAPVAAEQAAESPQAIGAFAAKAGRAVGKAAVKGAYGATAYGQGAWQVAQSNADQMIMHGVIKGISEPIPKAAAADTVFDK
ncbi:hypothetical protein [Streptomyces syringium]|uniref:hypothetical protein n=1 Tax=Streptomyces syringium TaxID=76729 RepID=UPI0033E7E343